MKFSPEDVEMLEGFMEEAPDYLEGLESKILNLENDYSEENIDDLFRSFHSLKGMAGFVNLSAVVTICHELEDILKALKKGEIKFSDKITDLLLEGTDVLKEIVSNIASALEGYEEGEIDIEVEGLGEEEIQNMANKIRKGEEESEKEEIKEENETKEEGEDDQEALDFLAEFIEEFGDKLNDIDKYLLEFEKEQNDENINNLMRLFHSIKGDARLVFSMSPGKKANSLLTAIEEVSHAIEEVFQKIQNQKIKITADLIDLIFKGADLTKTIFNALREGKEISIDYKSYLKELEGRLGHKVEKKSTEEKEEKKEEPKEATFSALQNIVEQWIDYSGILAKDPTEDKFEQFKRMTENVKNGLIRLKEKEKLKEIEGIINLIDKKEAGSIRESVYKFKDWINEEKKKIETKEKSKKKEEQKVTTPTHHEVVSKTVRVERAKLDKLMNLVGEFITLKNGFASTLRELGNVAKFKDITGKMERLANDFQSIVMSMRMVPVSELFNRYQRTIRDLSKTMKKEIKLIIEGEDTELDRIVIEKLVDPMTHIIRNSADHGIEDPDTREKRGKPRTGKVWLRAYYKGSYAFIEIEDDGGGIDPNAVRSKAIERGLISPEQAINIPDNEVINFIFEPGFSTKKTVSNISGRGVGMDVVKTNIESIGGKVFVESELGKGTKITLRIPLSLSIILGLMFEVSNNRYIFPIEYVQETVKVQKDALHDYGGILMVDVRNEMLPLISLDAVLNGKEGIEITNKEYDFDLIPLIIVREGKDTVAFAVDRFLGESEFLVKSIPEYLRLGGIISGATILGNGDVVLIMDPTKLVM